MCVRACLRACACVCARACKSACERASVRACFVRACVCACVCVCNIALQWPFQTKVSIFAVTLKIFIGRFRFFLPENKQLCLFAPGHLVKSGHLNHTRKQLLEKLFRKVKRCPSKWNRSIRLLICCN